MLLQQRLEHTNTDLSQKLQHTQEVIMYQDYVIYLTVQFNTFLLLEILLVNINEVEKSRMSSIIF